MKRFLRSLINQTGFDIVRTINQNRLFDQHLRNVLEKYQIDCVLDVGANTGQYATHLRSIGFSGSIVSFEPVRSVFNELRERARADNRWLCYQLALGDNTEKRDINVYSSSVFSSFYEANEYSEGVWSSLRDVTRENVSVARLDDVMPEIADRTRSSRVFLKLDTQGHDLAVFKGALELLPRVYAMQSELAFIPVYHNMKRPYEVLEDFHKHGFFISGIFPINRDSSLAVIECDCVLVKRNLEEGE